MKDTKQQFEHVIALCRDLFSKKLHDYGPAWRILRPASVTDQIFIKANRIRSIETKGVTLIDEGIRAEFIAIVNYGIVGLIQLELGYAESADISNEEAMALYDKYAKNKEIPIKNSTADKMMPPNKGKNEGNQEAIPNAVR